MDAALENYDYDISHVVSITYTRISFAAGSGKLQFLAIYVQVCSSHLRLTRFGSLCLCSVPYRNQQDTGIKPSISRFLKVGQLD
jgi:hypothetical protein